MPTFKATSWQARHGAGAGGPARGQAGPSIFRIIGDGPGRPINFSCNGPRFVPVRQNYRGRAANEPWCGPAHRISIFHGPAQPSPARPGPARPGPPIFSNNSARPTTLAANSMSPGLYMGRAIKIWTGPPFVGAHLMSRTKKVHADVCAEPFFFWLRIYFWEMVKGGCTPGFHGHLRVQRKHERGTRPRLPQTA